MSKPGVLFVAIGLLLVGCAGAGSEPRGSVPHDDDALGSQWAVLLASDEWQEVNNRYLACMESKGYDYLGESEGDGVILLDGTLFKPATGGGHALEGEYLSFRVETEACSASAGVDELRSRHALANPTVNPNRLRAVNEYSTRVMGCLEERGWAIAEPKVSMGLVVFDSNLVSEEDQAAFERDRIQCNMDLYGAPGGPLIP